MGPSEAASGVASHVAKGGASAPFRRERGGFLVFSGTATTLRLSASVLEPRLITIPPSDVARVSPVNGRHDARHDKRRTGKGG